MTSLRQSLASKQASKQASRNTALYRGEYNKIQVHCCIDVFYGAVRFCFYKKQKTQL